MMNARCFQHYRARNISGKCILSVCLTALLCACSSFYGDPENQVTVLQAFFSYGRDELMALGESASAYETVMGFRMTDWFCMSLPLLAAFPSVYDFAEEWFGGSYYMLVSRSTRLRYAVNCMRRAAVTGFAVMTLGIVLFAVCVYLKFPAWSLYHVPPEESMTAMAYGASGFQRWFSFLKSVIHTGILAAAAAMFSTVLAVVTKDRFLALSLPVLAEYFSSKAADAYGMLLIAKFPDGDVPVWRHIPEFFMPSNHLLYDGIFFHTFGVGYWLYLLLMLTVLLLTAILFRQIVERRCE